MTAKIPKLLKNTVTGQVFIQTDAIAEHKDMRPMTDEEAQAYLDDVAKTATPGKQASPTAAEVVANMAHGVTIESEEVAKRGRPPKVSAADESTAANSP